MKVKLFLWYLGLHVPRKNTHLAGFSEVGHGEPTFSAKNQVRNAAITNAQYSPNAVLYAGQYALGFAAAPHDVTDAGPAPDCSARARRMAAMTRRESGVATLTFCRLGVQGAKRPVRDTFLFMMSPLVVLSSIALVVQIPR